MGRAFPCVPYTGICLDHRLGAVGALSPVAAVDVGIQKPCKDQFARSIDGLLIPHKAYSDLRDHTITDADILVVIHSVIKNSAVFDQHIGYIPLFKISLLFHINFRICFSVSIFNA